MFNKYDSVQIISPSYKTYKGILIFHRDVRDDKDGEEFKKFDTDAVIILNNGTIYRFPFHEGVLLSRIVLFEKYIGTKRINFNTK